MVEKTIWTLVNISKALRNAKVVFELKQIGDKWGKV
jgi:hypothetical protein